jgi:hypothetical protein
MTVMGPPTRREVKAAAPTIATMMAMVTVRQVHHSAYARRQGASLSCPLMTVLPWTPTCTPGRRRRARRMATMTATVKPTKQMLRDALLTRRTTMETPIYLARQ